MFPRALYIPSLLLTMLIPSTTLADAVDNESVVRAMVEAINARDLAALDEVVAEDVTRHSGATPELVIESRDQFKAFLEADFVGIPDSVQTIQQIFSAGDRVALRAIYSGTQTGQMGPFPPSGKRVEMPFLGILRIVNGKVAEIWVEWDNLNMLAQLGHFPPAG